MKTAHVIHFILVVSLTSSSALNFRGCGPDMPLEIQEGTENYEIICENIRPDYNVQWQLTRSISNNTYNNTGACLLANIPNCSGASGLLAFSRPNNSVSLARILKVVNRTLLGVASFTCQDYKGEDQGPVSSCSIDIIYGAEVLSCIIQALQSSSIWNLTGICNITKVFSTFNRYACQLWQNQNSASGTEVANVMYSPILDGNSPPYGYGSCSYSLPLPMKIGIYNFSVIVFPGEINMNAGTITVARPLQPPGISCSMSTFPFVRENGDLFCTCTASDLGLPTGRLIGYYGSQRLNTSNFGSGYLYFEKRNLTRTDDGTSVKCVLDWATQDTEDLNTSFTLHIAYGPDAVTIIGPDVFDINPSQVQNISLICKESVVSPYVNYTWTGCPSGNPMSPICTAHPSPNNINYFVQCTVSNPLSQVARTVNHTVELNYPPDKAPVISAVPSLNPSQPVYKRDNFTLICTVQGGKPVNATRVTFTCPQMMDMGDIIGTTEVSSSLRFFSVSSDNQGNCSCSAVWKNTTWYTQTAEWSLIVYTPPSAPIIFPLSDTTGNPAYPFMAGTSGTLVCQSNQSGRPEAIYSWPVSATGHTSGSNLNFYNLSREDNGRTVKCRASNSYTENRQPVDDATFLLQVYYEPIVSFTYVADGSNCVKSPNKSIYTLCIVGEGQRIHVNCTADSNPAPASFQWLSPSKDVYSNTSELVITSTNHTIHNGDYNCTVITKQVNKDSRLPLTSSAALTVVVGYSPSVLAFSINNVDAITVNIPEKSRVNMKCLCSGRPFPNIRLINAADPEQFLNQSQPTGDIFVDEQPREVLFTIDQIQCEASGFYKCDVNNSLGQDSQSRMLLVSCAPRKTFSDGQPLTVSVINGRGELRVRMTAYPTPVVKVLTYLGSNETSSGHPVKENIIFVECSSSFLAPAAVICTISLINVTQNEEGFYRIVYSNSFGELPFTFFVIQAMIEGDHQTKADQNIAAVAVLAVLFSVLLIVVVVFVIWVWRRGWTLPCSDVSSQRLTQQDQRGDASGEDLFSVTTNTSLMKEGGPTSLYDSLQMEDVGKRSQYEEVQRYQNASTTAPYEVVSDNKRNVRGDYT